MPPAIAFLLSPLFGAADRLAGGDYVARLRIPIRAVAVAALLLTAALALMHHSWAWFGLAWAAYRWDGWRVFGGKIDPRTWEEIDGTLLRHLFAVGLVPAAFLTGHNWVAAFLLTGVFASAATLLAIVLAHQADRGRDVTAWVEFARGCVFGLIVTILLNT